MKLLYVIPFFILFTSLSSLAQKSAEKNNTLETQFDEIYRTSTSYQSYKVIKKEQFKKLKLNVLDSLKASKKLVSEKENLLKIERENIQKTQKKLAKVQLDLETSTKKENSISFFGLKLSKTTYNISLWFLIVILILGLIYFIYAFFKSNEITKIAKNSQLEAEKEFEEYRKKSLENGQKLRRQLQDEINKQRNS